MAKMIDKLAWTPVRNRAVLFARSYDHRIFYSVGGKRESGETDEEALLREVLEETGATLDPSTIKHMKTFEGEAYGAPEGTKLQIAYYTGETTDELVPCNEVNELAWFTSADMHRTTATGQEILRWFFEAGLID